ncbi:hypothetical protein [Nocardia nova]|uniref:hypothetical protein n=1 Tax=Nocardia nova TaxID=37330 RepID=UPI002738336A|nr:hypothetical protein [Nocardia nova]
MNTVRNTTAIAMLAIAAITVTCGSATAEPTPPAISAPAGSQGTDQGIGYDITSAGTTLTATLTGGTFHLGDEAVIVTNDAGAIVATLPLRITAGDRELTLAPRITPAATTLVADVAAQDIGYWRKTSSRQRSIEAGIGIGAAIGGIGGIGGALLGIVVGIATMGMLIPITLPIGLLVGVLGGMAVGGAAGATIPNSDVPDQWDYQQECHGSGEYRHCW